MQQPAWQLTVDRAGGTSVVTLRGEFDMACDQQVRQALLDELRTAGPGGLVLDMSAVSFADSSALATLVAVRHAAAEHGRSFILRRPSPLVVRLLQLTGMTDFLAAR